MSKTSKQETVRIAWSNKRLSVRYFFKKNLTPQPTFKTHKNILLIKKGLLLAKSTEISNV